MAQSIQQIRNRQALARRAYLVLANIKGSDQLGADELAAWGTVEWDMLARLAQASRGTFSNDTKAVIVGLWVDNQDALQNAVEELADLLEGDHMVPAA